ncbi:MAG: hypothetical protein IJ624_04915 [Prevotella sp.]|nr:hypothetical protein [Prevotella sp.]
MNRTNAINLSFKQARIIEQSIINSYGFSRYGGQLYNIRNSISPKYWHDFGIRVVISIK